MSSTKKNVARESEYSRTLSGYNYRDTAAQKNGNDSTLMTHQLAVHIYIYIYSCTPRKKTSPYRATEFSIKLISFITFSFKIT